MPLSKTELSLQPSSLVISATPHTTCDSHIWCLSLGHPLCHVNLVSQPILRKLQMVVILAAKLETVALYLATK